MKLLLIAVVCLAVGSSWASNLENFESYQKHFNKVYRYNAKSKAWSKPV
jgi:hypothetical protein